LFILPRVQVHDCVQDAARLIAYAQDEPGAAVSCADEFAADVKIPACQTDDEAGEGFITSLSQAG